MKSAQHLLDHWSSHPTRRQEPTADRFSGPWFVMRECKHLGDYELESYYWEKNAIEAAEYLTKVEPDNSYYVEQREKE